MVWASKQESREHERPGQDQKQLAEHEASDLEIYHEKVKNLLAVDDFAPEELIRAQPNAIDGKKAAKKTTKKTTRKTTRKKAGNKKKAAIKKKAE